MYISLAGLIGAVVGAVVGLIEYAIFAALFEKRLRVAMAEAKSEAERQRYAKANRVLRLALLVGLPLGVGFAGYTFGATLGG